MINVKTIGELSSLIWKHWRSSDLQEGNLPKDTSLHFRDSDILVYLPKLDENLSEYVAGFVIFNAQGKIVHTLLFFEEKSIIFFKCGDSTKRFEDGFLQFKDLEELYSFIELLFESFGGVAHRLWEGKVDRGGGKEKTYEGFLQQNSPQSTTPRI